MQSISFEPCAQDLLAAYRLNLKTNLKSSRARRNLTLGGFAVAGLSAAANWIWPFTSLPIAALVGFLYWVLFVTAVFGAAYLRLPRQSKRIMEQQKSLHGLTCVEWSDEGISFVSPNGNSAFKWGDFTGIFSDSEAIILKQSDAVMNFIPTRVLSGEQISQLSQTGQNASPSQS